MSFIDIFKADNYESQEMVKVLKQINIFKDFTPVQLHIISKYFRKKVYPKNTTIFKEGDIGDGMYVIKSGAVKIVKHLENNEIKTLANLVDGDFFGELALLDGYPRSASVITTHRVEMYEMYRASLLELMNHKPRIGGKLAFNLAKLVGIRLRESGDKIKNLLMWKSVKNT